jgi:hypothetical protein
MEGPDLNTPSIKDAIRLIVSARAGQWSLDEIEAELTRRGWKRAALPFSEREAVELTVARLLATGEAERVRPGVIRSARAGRDAVAAAK